MRGYSIQNFGCRAAQADGAAVERQLAAVGMRRVDQAEAEVLVLNTCTVTAAADHDARAAIRRAHRLNPQAKILVTGCYAQRAPQEIAALTGVTWVVGNSHKNQIGNIVGGAPLSDFVPLSALDGLAARSEQHHPLPRPQAAVGGQERGLSAARSQEVSSPEQEHHPLPQVVLCGDIFAHNELQAAPVFEGIERVRPNLKVQDGCDNRCSFCVIPFVRGQGRSLALDKISRELDALERAGYLEVVISGINLGRWGRDLSPQGSFIQLLEHLLDRSTISKFRLSSIEPMDWSDELIALVTSNPRICRHAHLPLQSGSDRILRRMHRKYRPWHYAEKLGKIRAAMPDAAIGADVMVGFPGESDELFEESREFIEQMPFTYLHVFTYSPRPGTPAQQMPDQVPIAVARERNRILRDLAADKNRDFRLKFLGKELGCITLRQGSDSEHTDALSDNYLKLEIKGQHAANRLVRIRVDSLSNTGLVGNVVVWKENSPD